jgi:glycyl-tRNA synthetase beta chain
MKRADLLLEIGTEELPPTALRNLSDAFRDGIVRGLDAAQLHYAGVEDFSTPRRLAVLVRQLDAKQTDENVERRGPALQAAFGDDGCPTKAAVGFAKSCGVDVSELETLETEKGAWLVFHTHKKGQPTPDLVPELLKKALDQLPIPKRMRWGSLDDEFVRPVQWIVALFNDKVVPFEMFGVKSGRESRGHRFHHPGTIYIPSPDEYEALLESEGRVLVDFNRRRLAVRGLVEEAAAKTKGRAVINDALLDEVTAMVEWPVPVVGNFEPHFLEMPAEVLITTMKVNQKYFHVVDKQGQLLPHFITLSNIDSRDPDKVREGNERVIRPRLIDAMFFWNQDRNVALSSRVTSLQKVVFQKKLGTLFEKMQRISEAAAHIAARLGGDRNFALRAGELCKCDLMTEMVGEFPELQGTMGRYYALHDGEPWEVAQAIEQHYKPRFAGDDLPDTVTGQALAVADKLDTIVGIFAVGQAPTGDKDPYALRRAGLGVLRILIEKQIPLNLVDLIQRASDRLPEGVHAHKVAKDVAMFMRDRLKSYYHERGVRADLFDAVIAVQDHTPQDLDRRINAVAAFRELPEADSLAAANKRIANILKKSAPKTAVEIDTSLFLEPAEQTLNDELAVVANEVASFLDNRDPVDRDYSATLNCLAGLREPVDAFFDGVMVMADDEKVRNNRISLLKRLHDQFMQVADISRLQG